MSRSVQYLAILILAGLAGSACERATGAPLTEAQIYQAHIKAGLKLLPTSPEKPKGIGLFIGISEYDVPNHQLNGCVFDALGLYAVFTERFNVTHPTILTNRQASHANIISALQDIIKRTQAAYDGTNRIPVVVTFSGHGVQATNKSEADGKDEMWMTGDAALNARGALKSDRLLWDDDIKNACDEIVDVGGHVILISDSCHSGTMHRIAGKVRQLDPRIEVEPATQVRNLFKKAKTTRAGSRGFVFFAACRDDEVEEETDADGVSHGRLSHVLIETLNTMPKKTTYDELAKIIAVKFVSRNFTDQHPQYHRSNGTTNELFMGGGYAAPHAKLVRKSLTMGKYHGVAEGAVFKLYATLDDLENDSNSIGTATATKVGALTTEIETTPKSLIHRRMAVAKLDMARFGNFKVFIGKNGIPDALRDLVAQMVKENQLQIVDESQCDVAVYAIGTTGRVGIFPSAALPDASTGLGGVPQMVIKESTEKKLAFAVARALLRRARADRFFSLDYGMNKVTVNVVPDEPNKTNNGKTNSAKPINWPREDGVLQLTDGDRFRFNVQNKSGKPLYAYIFGLRTDGSLSQLYPDNEDNEIRPIAAGQTAIVPSGDPFHALRFGDESVMRGKAKVILTSEPFDFRSLLYEPDIGKAAKRSGGLSNQLGQFVNELLSGDQVAVKNRGSLTDWAATTVLFDIRNKLATEP